MSPDEEEDDYMSMAIPEPEKPKFETSVQRRARQKREAEARARTKSKKEQADEETRAREEALATKMDESSRGFKMLSKLGYKPGTALGAKDNLDARLDPIGIEVKDSRSGIGLDSEKKRKFREEHATEVKRVKASEDDYRERVAKEREDKRNEGLWRAAMAVLEGLETEEAAKPNPLAGDSNDPDESHAVAIGVGPKPERSKPLSTVNILYRTLVRKRQVAERERRMRYDLQQSLSQNPSYADDTEKDDQPAAGDIDDDIEVEDPELDELEALEPGDRLEKVLEYLRTQYNYCFWCKFRYPNSELDGCPGLSEEDHD